PERPAPEVHPPGLSHPGKPTPACPVLVSRLVCALHESIRWTRKRFAICVLAPGGRMAFLLSCLRGRSVPLSLHLPLIIKISKIAKIAEIAKIGNLKASFQQQLQLWQGWRFRAGGAYRIGRNPGQAGQVSVLEKP